MVQKGTILRSPPCPRGGPSPRVPPQGHSLGDTPRFSLPGGSSLPGGRSPAVSPREAVPSKGALTGMPSSGNPPRWTLPGGPSPEGSTLRALPGGLSPGGLSPVCYWLSLFAFCKLPAILVIPCGYDNGMLAPSKSPAISLLTPTPEIHICCSYSFGRFPLCIGLICGLLFCRSCFLDCSGCLFSTSMFLSNVSVFLPCHRAPSNRRIVLPSSGV